MAGIILVTIPFTMAAGCRLKRVINPPWQQQKLNGFCLIMSWFPVSPNPLTNVREWSVGEYVKCPAWITAVYLQVVGVPWPAAVWCAHLSSCALWPDPQLKRYSDWVRYFTLHPKRLFSPFSPSCLLKLCHTCHAGDPTLQIFLFVLQSVSAGCFDSDHQLGVSRPGTSCCCCKCNHGNIAEVSGSAVM